MKSPSDRWYIQFGKVYARNATATDWTDDLTQAYLWDIIEQAERVAHVGYFIRKYKGDRR